MNRLRPLTLSLLVATVTVTAESIPCQGEFVNFETAPIAPLAIARIDDHDYLLVCNTPDNSVEIYDTIDMTLVSRIGVGLRPVTVEWNPFFRRFYTANFVGDSVSQVSFMPPSPGQPPVARLERTTPVGDEPTDIEFLPDWTSFFVTLGSRSAVGWYDSIFHVPAAIGLTERIDLTIPMLNARAPLAVKEPRRVALAGPVLTVLGHKGGNNPSVYDFDVLVWNFATGYQTALGELGSTNFNMEHGPDGRLYAVGMFARNSLAGEDAVRRAPTGFTESRLFVVDGFAGPGSMTTQRDLNRTATGTIVPKAQAVAYPTDLALLTSGSDVTKIFVTGFSSDRIGVLHNPLDASAVATWPMTHIDVPNGRGGYARTGPRALQLKEPAGVVGDPGRRLYVLNWLNQSITVVDPTTESVLQTVPLQNDPTPAAIRTGREFLYSADLSGRGFTSCASCHIDGRTDFLTWNLGDPAGGNDLAVPPELLDGTIGSFFNKDKGPLVTQSLQGMLQHPVDGFGRSLLTNAPFHWRGDRFGFTDFNGAFVNLLDAPNLGSSSDPIGVTTSQMIEFERMVETIMYPPNPEQPLDRLPGGSFGLANDENTGSGAARGLKLFHTRPALAGRSCAHCHALPPGTNHRIVQNEGNPTSFSAQPLKSPQLRGLFQRESSVESPTLAPGIAKAGEFGLLRRGIARSSIDRILRAFSEALPGQDKLDVAAYLRQIDWGTAPIVGVAATADVLTVRSASLANRVALMEQQVEVGNAGLAVIAHLSGATAGYYYDVSVTPPVYRRVDTGGTTTRQALLDAVVRGPDRLVFQSTEAGSELRVAALDGIPPMLTGPTPSNVTLEPMRASAHFLGVADLTKNWDRGTGPNDFNFIGIEPITGRRLPDPVFLRAQRIYQHALIQTSPVYGVTRLGHDASRRFRVAATDLRLGCKLRLHVPVDAPPPVNANPQTEVIELTLFPTTEQTGDGRRVWTTTAELPQFVTLTLLCGGPFAPGVRAARVGAILEPPAPGTFDVAVWNKYRVDVVNADGTQATGGWQSLRIE